MDEMSVSSGAGYQTLSRGLRVLEVLADAPGPLSTEEIATALGVHRSIAYRLVRTLEDHRFVSRDAESRASLGTRIASIAAGSMRDVQLAARPELAAVAEKLGMTAFLVTLDGTECVTLTSVQPRTPAASMAQRPGSRHPAVAGAPGRALLAQLSEDDVFGASMTPAVAAQIADVRTRGFATSHDEILPSVHSVAVPLRSSTGGPLAIAVVYVTSEHDDDEIADQLSAAAASIARTSGAAS